MYASLKIKLRGKPEVPATVKVKRDTGAQGSVLPLRTYRRMYPTNLDTDGCPMSDRLENQNTIFIVYNGQQIIQYGTMDLQCSYGAKKSNAKFFVADTHLVL